MGWLLGGQWTQWWITVKAALNLQLASTHCTALFALFYIGKLCKSFTVIFSNRYYDYCHDSSIILGTILGNYYCLYLILGSILCRTSLQAGYSYAAQCQWWANAAVTADHHDHPLNNYHDDRHHDNCDRLKIM